MVETAYAYIWEFGSDGAGSYPFLPKGYMVATDSGEYWLSSRFKNTVGGVLYTGTINGLSYIDAVKMDGSGYTIYALTDRNPREYQYLAAYKNGIPIEDFGSYIGVPGRVEEEDYMGSNANWRIPIIGLRLEAGAYYEFAFRRGMIANNGISFVLAEDGMGFMREPFTQEEAARYEEEKDKEYEFITSYWKVEEEDGNYYWDYTLVPMRFAIQTYADLGTWRRAADEAAAFLDSVTAEDISSGRYIQTNLENLRLLIADQEADSEKRVKLQLQDKAEASMAVMVAELAYALSQAESQVEMLADVSVLEELIRDATILYEKAIANPGTQIGQYSLDRAAELKERIDYAVTLPQTAPQTVINKAVRDLRDAIVRLLNSKIRKPTIMLSDEASGVKVVAPQGSIPEGTVLHVNTAEHLIDWSGELKNWFGDKAEEILFYDLRLTSGSIGVVPTEGIDIQIPEGAGLSGRSISVYFNDGTAEPYRLSSIASSTFRVFSSEQAGTFALVVRPSTAGIPTGADKRDTPPPQEMTTVTIVEETEVELDEEPEQVWEELVEDIGPVEEPDDFDYGQQWGRGDVLDSVEIPLDELRREGSSVYLVLVAGIMTVAAMILAVAELSRGRANTPLNQKWRRV
jgi:hypothetical protein